MLRFLSSMRLAVILIAAIAGLSVSATLYDMREIFSSMPFRILVVAFFVNLLTCTVKLWPGLVRTLRRKAVDLVDKEGAFSPSQTSEEMICAYLHKQRYRVDQHTTAAGTYIYAAKGRLSLLAPHVLHIGILIIIIGAALTSFAVKEKLQLAPGEALPLPPAIAEKVGEGIIKVDKFETVYDDKGSIANWVTTFDLSIGQEDRAKGATTSVNHPYKAHGLSIYQMAYANRYLVNLSGGHGDIAGAYAFPEDQPIPLEKGSMMLSAMAENVILVTHYDADGKRTGQQALRKGASLDLGDGLKVEYQRPISFTVLEFKYTKAIPVVFFGFILSSLASMMFWLGRFRSVSVFIASDGGVRATVYTKSRALRDEIREALGLSRMEA